MGNRYKYSVVKGAERDETDIALFLQSRLNLLRIDGCGDVFR